MDLIDRVKRETKATRKKRSDHRPTEDADEYVVEDEQDIKPQTPRKKRKTFVASTPRGQVSATKLLTASQKR